MHLSRHAYAVSVAGAPAEAGRRQLLTFLAPLAFLVPLLALKMVDKPLYWQLVVEDGLFENMTAGVYALAALAMGAACAASYRAGARTAGHVQLLLAAGFLLIGLEEISWGQRIFGIESPEFFKTHNAQQELNLHNFGRRRPLHLAFILVGAYGAAGWLIPPGRLSARLRGVFHLVTPSWVTSLYFLPTFLLYLYYDYLSTPLAALSSATYGFDHGMGYRHFIISRDQEAIELLLALGFLLFAVGAWRRQAEKT